MSPTPDAFAALARSSPWRWSTLRFTVRWPGDRWRARQLRAWLRRPDVVRVETVDGELLQIVREHPQQVSVLTPTGGRTRALPWPGAPETPAPELRADGLVARRPEHVSFDAPMYRDYHWVAMLDPAELADGRDPDTGAFVTGVVVDGVTEVEHAGRPAWEAVARATPAYEPRCTCCSLLRARWLDVLEFGADSDRIGEPADYPEACRVRLDVGTGVCVLTEEIGGARHGAGHDLLIEAVDEPMDDALFVAPRPHRRRRFGPPRPGVVESDGPQ